MIPLLLLLASTATFAVTFAQLCLGLEFLRLSIFFLLVCAIAVGGSAYWSWESRDKIRSRMQGFRWNQTHSFFAILFVVTAAVRLWHLGHTSIWLDEDIQANNASGHFDFVFSAATQQQPPLDYFFEGLALKMFGYQPWAARLSSALFGILIPFMLAGLVHRISKSARWALITGALAALNPWLIAYSQEGRPYSCSLFFLSLYLLVSHAAFFEAFSWTALLGVAASAFLYLSSVGFQPPLMLLCLCTTALLFASFGNGRKILYLNGATLLGLILFLPLQLNISQFSHAYLKEAGHFSVYSLATYLRNFDYNIFFGFLNGPPKSSFVRYLMFPSVALALVLGMLSKPRQASWLHLLFFTLSSTFFLFLSITAYHILVEWTAQPQTRYVLAILPVWIVGFVLALFFLSRTLNFKLIGAIVAVLLIGTVFELPYAYKEKLENCQALFEFIKNDAKQPALVTPLSIHKIGIWSPKGIAAVNFYGEQVSSQTQIHNNWDPGFESQADFLVRSLTTKNTRSNLYFVLFGAVDRDPTNPYHRFAASFPTFARVHDVAGLSILIIQNNVSLRATLHETLEKFEALFGETDLNRNVFETSVRLALNEDNCLQAKNYMVKLNRVSIGDTEHAYLYRNLNQGVIKKCGI